MTTSNFCVCTLARRRRSLCINVHDAFCHVTAITKRNLLIVVTNLVRMKAKLGPTILRVRTSPSCAGRVALPSFSDVGVSRGRSVRFVCASPIMRTNIATINGSSVDTGSEVTRVRGVMLRSGITGGFIPRRERGRGGGGGRDTFAA